MADFYIVGSAAFAPASGRNGSKEKPWIFGTDTIVGTGRWSGGDVLNVVPGAGWDTWTTLFSIPSPTGTSESNRAIVDFNGESLAAAGSYVYNVRPNIVIRNFNRISTLRLAATAVNFVLIDGNEMRSIVLENPGNHTNYRFARIKKFTQPDALPANSTVGAMVWRPSDGQVAGLYRITVEDCGFENYIAGRGVITFFGYGTPRAQDLVFRNLTFKNYSGVAIDVEVPGPTSDPALVPVGTPGWSTGIITENIRCENCTAQTATTGSFFGGAVFISGFGPSTTPGFGPNLIGPVYGKNISGDAGMCDLLWGSYLGKQADFDVEGYPDLRGKCLWVDGLHTPNIDGCVLLADINCYDCRFEGIYARNVTGNPARVNSGAVFLSLQNPINFVISGIDADNVKTVIFIGNTGNKASMQISGITATNVKDYFLYMSSSATLSNNVQVSNYVAKGAPGQGLGYSFYTNRTWNGATNGFINDFPAGTFGHTLSADTRVGVDPKLDAVTRRPRPDSPLIGAGKFVGYKLKDASGRRYRAAFAIGAYESTVVKPRQLRKFA
jgi:hypothetical protein